MGSKYFIVDQNLAIKIFHDILVNASEENEIENIDIESFYDKNFKVIFEKKNNGFLKYHRFTKIHIL